jgi:DNA polymerase
MNQIFTERVKAEVIQITGVQNPNSRNQLLEWLNGATPGNFENFTKLDKDTVQGIINGAPEPIIQKVLEARQYISKASVAKYAAMKNYACADGRARGFLKFYKANRTGRWAGTGIQPHNLTKHKCSPEQLDVMRELIKAGDVEGLAAVNKGDLTGALSQCVRTSFIAKPGHHFLVSDYSAIEARVLAWLAGETWRLEFFKGEGDIYIESAARMFKVPADSIGKKDPLRQNGKVAELACIAEGQLVLTDKGLVPIQDVKFTHRVWDGRKFTQHEGVISRGKKHVYKYQGLTATLDHKVFVVGYVKAIPLSEAIARNLALRSTRPENNSYDLRFSYVGELETYDILNCGPQNRFTVSGVLVHNCGYQGGVGALIQMDRDGAIDQKLMPSIIKLWREENPAIVAFWKNLENAALKALVNHDQYIPVGREPKIWFYFNSKSGNLHMVLPSGRWLTYVRAKIVPGKFGNSAVQYEGVENGKWGKVDTYSGKLAENATQAVARDILAQGIYNLDRAGFEIVLHVHDETVSEEPINGRSLEEVNHLMCLKAPWYEDLPLKAEGFVSPYYKKDDK